ncbi:GAF domain-containing protein [Lysobacter solisilvae]|uniref:GAF domain-containing protein n=1 Tax=Agrilutibacter solisilvae TaxID=2763317 RepID=A0A975ARN2_9GAMM|nr:GAF domain-containing protein [Lysobacter solisilvae]QSX77842.1 GAF domain-containing protein [Lysobacter solisilvae]
MIQDPILQRALDECMREPIHLSGAIQPHGVLLVYERHSSRIVAASQNATSLFAMDRLIDLPVSDVLDPAAVAALDAMVLRGETRSSSQFIAQANVGEWGSVHDVSAHLAGTLVHVELEPVSTQAAGGSSASGAHAMAAALEGMSAGHDFFQAVAEQVRELVGYDRVMVYRFLHDHSGEVIAEACAQDMSPYLGLRYPASDIPAQARALYLSNRIRVIPDVGYAPVPVLLSQALDGPLDMSYDVLRSVSPVHVEYLRNMGIAASMSVSLIVEGRLWGLVACHHRTPRLVPARQRTVLDMFGRHVSLILGARDLRESGERLAQAREYCDRLEERLSGVADAGEELRVAVANLRDALPGDGCALLWGGRWLVGGVVPAPEVLEQALTWARTHAAGQMACTEVASDWRDASSPAGDGCGVLAVRMPNAWMTGCSCSGGSNATRCAGRAARTAPSSSTRAPCALVRGPASKRGTSRSPAWRFRGPTTTSASSIA